MRELTKDLENLKGDFLQQYQTIPVVYGEKASKIMLTILSIFTLVPIYLLLYKFTIGYMHLYFHASVVLLILFLVILWKSKTKIQYILLHNILKFIILAGVFSILLIDVSVILNRI